MVTKSLRKNFRRDIWQTMTRFISILVITALGAGFFAGLRAVGPDMRRTADTYYADNNLMDYRILSSVGFTDDDVEAVRQLDGIEAVMPAQRVDALMTSRLGETAMRIHSLPDSRDAGDAGYINQLVLLEGRLPQATGECVVGSASFGSDEPFALGDVLTVADGNDDATRQMLDGNSFTVVGIAQTPLYISTMLGSTSVGSGTLYNFIYVPLDAFTPDYYTELYATSSKSAGLAAYSDAYDACIDDGIDALEKLADERTALRYDELTDQAQQYALMTGQPAPQIDKPVWYVYGRADDAAYAGFDDNSKRIDAIASFVPIFFFLVAALVSLTTMTRMVEEQRLQIGALKALGFGKGSIAYKYVCYAALASTAGAAGGIATGVILFPKTVWKAYNETLYQLPAIRLAGNAGYIILSLAVSVLCTTLAAFMACNGSLRAVPARLMRPKAPKAGKRVLLERIPFIWNRLKFSNKVTVRNLFLNKKRFFMTIIGVLGCTALLLTGFGLNDAVTGIAPRQYGEIELYDAAVSLRDASSSDEDTTLNTALSGIAQTLYYEKIDVDAGSDEVGKTALAVSLLIAEDPVRLNDFVHFAHRQDGQIIDFPQGDGVILTEKLAAQLKVETGDTIEVSTQEIDGTDKQVSLTVAGIMENYVDHNIYITPDTYRALFDAEPAYNLVMVRFYNNDADAVSGYVRDIIADDNVVGALDVSVLRDNIIDMLQSLNAVISLIIVSAALLAFVVLYNLTNINITERVREIATLKVLGFYEGEVNRYIFRESRVLTVIGIALGLVGGIYLTRYVATTAEVNEVMFRRTIQPLSYLYAVAFTILSAEMVNLVMRRTLKRIDMVESLKSAE